MCIEKSITPSRGDIWSLRNNSALVITSHPGAKKVKGIVIASHKGAAPVGTRVTYSSDMGHVRKCDKNGECKLHPLDLKRVLSNSSHNFMTKALEHLAEKINRAVVSAATV